MNNQEIYDLKKHIIEDLNLEEYGPETLDENLPLFGDEGLGLDSIDVLELILILEKYYGLRVANPEEGKKIFRSVQTIADYITSNSESLTQ
ncbi:MAG: phosphopantetheine-binding protein [Dysgonamonadaceae bacterium]|jgi:acyl carrier protein|nr:phosphopantetheine-binding protein [Dysgonamonadaceae bacterium]